MKTLEERVKKLAWNLEYNFSVGDSLQNLSTIEAPLEYFEKYDIETLANKYYSFPDHFSKAWNLKKRIKQLEEIAEQKKVKKNQENLGESENSIQPNRKRCNTSPINTLPKNFKWLPVDVFTKNSINKSKKSSKEEEEEKPPKNGQIKPHQLEYTTDEKKQCEGSTQTQLECDCDEYVDADSFLLKGTTDHKLAFIKEINRVLTERDEEFKRKTIAEFEGITKLPKQFQYWYQCYESYSKYRYPESTSDVDDTIPSTSNNVDMN